MNKKPSLSVVGNPEPKSGFFRKVNEIMRRVRRPAASRPAAPTRQTQLEFPLSD